MIEGTDFGRTSNKEIGARFALACAAPISVQCLIGAHSIFVWVRSILLINHKQIDEADVKSETIISDPIAIQQRFQ
jgi:hypothetical protein